MSPTLAILEDPRGERWVEVYREVERRRDPALLARHVARMFEDPGHPRVPEMLGVGLESAVNLPLLRLAMTAPTLVPIDLVRVLARSRHAGVRDAAMHVLAVVHEAEDAEAVLAHHVERGETLSFGKTQDVLWLAGLGESERLVPLLEPRSLFELARRRRCAGMATELRVQARRLLEIDRAEDWVRRIAFELDDKALADDVRKPPGPVAPPLTLEKADQRFLANELDDTHNLDLSAYAAYAYVLRVEPSHAYAALQLAWIDRAYGTPITPARGAWLRDLGVAEPMLDELAIPTVPIAGARIRRYKDPTEAQRIAVRTQLDRATDSVRGPRGSRP